MAESIDDDEPFAETIEAEPLDELLVELALCRGGARTARGEASLCGGGGALSGGEPSGRAQRTSVANKCTDSSTPIACMPKDGARDQELTRMPAKWACFHEGRCEAKCMA